MQEWAAPCTGPGSRKKIVKKKKWQDELVWVLHRLDMTRCQEGSRGSYIAGQCSMCGTGS